MSLLTVRQAAGRLGVGYSTLKHWIYEGRVRTNVTSGGHHRIADAEVDRLLAPSTTAKAKTAARLRTGPNAGAAVVDTLRSDGLRCRFNVHRPPSRASFPSRPRAGGGGSVI